MSEDKKLTDEELEAKKKAEQLKADAEEKAKADKAAAKADKELVTMYHKNNSVIRIKKGQVEAHKKAGWRLDK